MKTVIFFLVLLATFASAQSNSSCVEDISMAVIQIGVATADIAAAAGACGNATSAQCTADIANAVAALSSATADVNQAVTDCGGMGSACVGDLADTVTYLSAATADIANAVTDCGAGHHIACTDDIASASVAITKAGFSIDAAVHDC